jgi:molybdopterin-guanine dinucleotide biosynthesis protein
MRTLVLDKIASVARACGLTREVRISGDIPCEEGVVVAVRVLTEKTSYDQLELTSGRLARVKKGDRVAGALGHREALFGYAGRMPDSVRPGDTIEMLNMGGVLGVCEGHSPDLGPPFECEVLGSVLHFPVLGERIGVPARIGEEKLASSPALETGGVPVVALVGTCMSAGKTAAACALVRAFTHSGLRVNAFKATGVSLRRDILAMEDAGAIRTGLFTDLGIVTTTESTAPAITRTLLTKLAADRPDVVVVELGDGLLGSYGVKAILRDAEIRDSFTAVVLAANDPTAAWGGVRLLRDEYGIEPTAVTGPATDNRAGSSIVKDLLSVDGYNARTEAERLAEHVRDAIERSRERGAEVGR